MKRRARTFGTQLYGRLEASLAGPVKSPVAGVFIGQNLILASLLFAFAAGESVAWGQTSNVVSYQGRLAIGGGTPDPAERFDLQFRLFDTNTGGMAVDESCIPFVPVDRDGVFSVEVTFDTWDVSFNPQWLELGVRRSGDTNDFTPLQPRQHVTSVPKALHAQKADAAGILIGPLLPEQLPAAAARLDQSQTFTATPMFYSTSGPPFEVGRTQRVDRLNSDLLDGMDSSAFWRRRTVGATEIIGPDYHSNALELAFGTQRALRLEPNYNGAANVIGGAGVNSILAGTLGAVIAGGGTPNDGATPPTARPNTITVNYGAILGGIDNRVINIAGTIGGGRGNEVQGGYGGILGGRSNRVEGDFGMIPGGEKCRASYFAFAAGRRAMAAVPGAFVWADNTDADFAAMFPNEFAVRAQGGVRFVTGGAGLMVDGVRVNTGPSVVPDGSITASQLADGATLAELIDDDGPGSGLDADRLDGLSSEDFWRLTGNAGTSPLVNFLGTTDQQALEIRVNNERALRIEPTQGSPNLIGGYSGNRVLDGTASVIAGGGAGIGPHSIAAHYAAIGGGVKHTIAGGANGAVIAGGEINVVGSNAVSSAIGGGQGQTIHDDAPNATIAGGYANEIWSGVSTISGGSRNTISNDCDFSTVGGGRFNRIETSSWDGTIAGGSANTIGSDSDCGAIAGGYDNHIADNGDYGTIPGGSRNFATNYAFAAGHRAKANHTGSFVWADGNDADFASQRTDQMRIRAYGGARFDVSPTDYMDIRYLNGVIGRFIDTSTGAYLSLGGTWVDNSDANLKENFAPVDGAAILAAVSRLPISTWNYRREADEVRHIGPTAQDFQRAFKLSPDDKHIASLDGNGVALAAIQGLNQKLEELNSQLNRRDAENSELKARLERLEALVAAHCK